MLNRLSGWINRISSGWVMLAAVVLFALFTAVVLPDQAASAEAYTGDAGSPDTGIYYTAAELYELAEAYGQEGRSAYVRARFTFDLIWPLVYTFFLTTAISWLSLRAFSAGSPWQRANLAPLAGMVFDYLENLAAALVMVRYPATTPVVDALAGVFTLLKWFFVYGSFVLLLASALVAAWRWVRARRSA